MTRIKLQENFQAGGKVQDLNREKEVFAAMFNNHGEAVKVTELMDVNDFYNQTHKKLFLAVLGVLDTGQEVTPINVIDQISKHSKDTEREMLKKLVISYAADLPMTETIRNCLALKELSFRRKMINVASELIDYSTDLRKDPFDVQEQFIELLEKTIPKLYTDDRANGKEDILNNIKQRVIDSKKGKIIGIDIGIPSLMENLIIKGGKLILIGARPSMGKSSFAFQIAKNIVDIEKGCVGIISAEMVAEEVYGRVASNDTQITIDKIEKGKLNQIEEKKVLESISKYADKIIIPNGSRFHISKIKSLARKWRNKHGIKALIVDYIQRCSGTGDNRTQEIGDISFGLKEIAMELNIPVIALSQLGRVVEQRANKEPMLSDLKESGDLEQDADIVLFLYRPGFYLSEKEMEEKNISEGYTIVKCSKNRQGKAPFTIKMDFLLPYMTWKDLEYKGPKIKNIPNNSDLPTL